MACGTSLGSFYDSTGHRIAVGAVGCHRYLPSKQCGAEGQIGVGLSDVGAMIKSTLPERRSWHVLLRQRVCWMRAEAEAKRPQEQQKPRWQTQRLLYV